MAFDGDPGEDDATIESKVELVKDAIRGLIDAGLATRKSWFT